MLKQNEADARVESKVTDGNNATNPSNTEGGVSNNVEIAVMTAKVDMLERMLKDVTAQRDAYFEMIQTLTGIKTQK